MPAPKPRSKSTPTAPDESLVKHLTEKSQIDFESELFDALVVRLPDYAEVLQAQAGNYTRQGRWTDGLKVDQRIVHLRPSDPTAHYNLACRYALMKQTDPALQALRKAVELGFRDFREMTRDEDLASIRKDPRFRQLLKEHAPPRSR